MLAHFIPLATSDLTWLSISRILLEPLIEVVIGRTTSTPSSCYAQSKAKVETKSLNLMTHFPSRGKNTTNRGLYTLLKRKSIQAVHLSSMQHCYFFFGVVCLLEFLALEVQSCFQREIDLLTVFIDFPMINC